MAWLLPEVWCIRFLKVRPPFSRTGAGARGVLSDADVRALCRWVFRQPPAGLHAPRRCLYCPREARIIPAECHIGNAFFVQVVEASAAFFFDKHPDYYQESCVLFHAVELRACELDHFTAYWAYDHFSDGFGGSEEYDDSELDDSDSSGSGHSDE